MLGVVVERVVVVSPGPVVVVIQKPSIGGMPDLQIRRNPKHQQHHSNDGHRNGGNAACREDAQSDESLADHDTPLLGAKPGADREEFAGADQALRAREAPFLPSGLR